MRASGSHALGAFEPSRLEVRWQRRRVDILENLRVVVWGPRDVGGLHKAESFFRLRVPPVGRLDWQLAGSLVCHAFLLSAVLATSRMAPPAAQLPLPEVHITWYGPARDVVPKIAPPPKQSQPTAQARPKQPRQKVATQGYNPHTTVVFQPPHATNRRQLLIEPQASPQPPESLPAMPNIIQWEASSPARPEIAIDANQLRAVRGKESEQARLRAPRIIYQASQGPMNTLSSRNAPVAPPSSPSPRAIRGVRAAAPGEAGAAAPALVRAAPARGDLALAGGKGAAPAPPLPVAPGAIHATRAASSYVAAQGSPPVGTGSLGPSTLQLPADSGASPLPPLTSSPNAVRAQSSKGSGSSVAAPNIGLAAGSGSLVSLSLSPGKTPPPPGNAYAPMSIGPHPGGKGSPAASNSAGNGGSGKAPGFPAPEGSTTGPEGLMILHDANSPAPPPVPQPPAAALPKPARVAHGPAAAAVSRRPVPRPGTANPETGHGLSPIVPAPVSVANNVLLVGVIVQDQANRTYGTWSMPSLAMNLPKLSNSRGTWVLDFADPMPSALREQNKVIVPLPSRAVEPQYPEALRQKGVRGKVVLRAVIGSDGKVSQIRVTQGLNPVLDQNAKAAFAHWKFEPALLNDKPVAMPVVVTVPFFYTPAPH